MVRSTLSVCLCGFSFTALLTFAPGMTAGAAGETRTPWIKHKHSPCADESRPGGKSSKRSTRYPSNDEPTAYPVSRPSHAQNSAGPDGDEPTPSGATTPDRTVVRLGARQFRTHVEQKRVRLLNDERDRAQVECLCLEGLFPWPAPPSSRAGRSRPSGKVAGPPATDEIFGNGIDRNASNARFLRSENSPPTGQDDGTIPAGTPAPVSNGKTVPVSGATEPPLELFQMLNALASHSTAEKPLTIMSLLRPPYKTSRYARQSPTNPHALGIAVDIAAFGGHAIANSEPEEEVQACLALLRSLAPGRYRMGLPKAPPPPRAPDPGVGIPYDPDGDPSPTEAPNDRPRVDSRGALPSRGARRQDSVRRPIITPDVTTDPSGDQEDAGPGKRAPVWPFFPAPQKGLDAQGKVVNLFSNEHYAAEEYLNDPRIRKALVEARRRGVDVFALFPDGENHIHVDVRQVP